MRRRWIATGGLLAVGGLTGAVATVAVRGGASVQVEQTTPPVSTAFIVRTNLATTVLTQGTLGYAPTAPVVNRLAGTYTGLPSTGARIRRGRSLYRVDDQPIILMIGSVPAWRSFGVGMSAGPDVRELEQNLIALHDAAGLFTAPGDQYDWAVTIAVERWQAAAELPVTGRIAFGQVVFLPGPILVGAPAVALGAPASPGEVPYEATTTRRVVSVPVDQSNGPAVTVGEEVSIVLPNGSATPARVTALGQPSITSPGSGPAAAGNGAGAAPGAADITVTPLHPAATGEGGGVPVQVSFTTTSASDVLAAPVSALLALAGGGYAVEVVAPSGHERLVGVTTGIFAGSRVELQGGGIAAGMRVVVAQ